MFKIYPKIFPRNPGVFKKFPKFPKKSREIFHEIQRFSQEFPMFKIYPKIFPRNPGVFKKFPKFPKKSREIFHEIQRFSQEIPMFKIYPKIFPRNPGVFKNFPKFPKKFSMKSSDFPKENLDFPVPWKSQSFLTYYTWQFNSAKTDFSFSRRLNCNLEQNCLCPVVDHT